MHREYYALVKGIIEENDGKIDAPIGRDPKSPVKFAVNLHSGKEAITFFHVITRYHEGYTLISCRLLTGRTHQIRVHLDAIGHPVVGDPLYGIGNRSLYSEGQLLHAYRLSFIHPLTKKPVHFEAPILISSKSSESISTESFDNEKSATISPSCSNRTKYVVQ